MIDIGYVRRMARYNAWQNASLYAAADTLSDDDRRRDRGAFFGSIHDTLAHLCWADRMWMSRWSDIEKAPYPPKEAGAHYTWEQLQAERTTLDARILRWADAMDAAWIGGRTTWFSGIKQRDVSEETWLLVTHLFNHQTHHRGQAHAMLTAAGTDPDETDIWLMPDRFINLSPQTA
ncbi:DinB family protein [Variibacter gotjawalensis]|uniref:DinB family protein n=1 Tax=Variibacter gotjawalensis TaxID=1333996 RepID=A0A0S3PV13_9BRAD|nr:DinB family protein [Variibacter gotjawalensis]NIK50129.1 putative damage-inducible protein DinB [Variibacter gotjawalensis]RZS46126.1 putative damage-inducible protein DinB [Variibacter gotjawalensis]BAT59802.1 DinB family protein [Variibacter gotjawalensis]